jgi:large subunit ribosomal protein L24
MKKIEYIKKLKIKIGDKVKILAGDYKGIIGNITSLNRKNLLLTIDSISNNEKSSKKKLNLIHYSNVMAWDSNENISSKISYKFENNKKKRFFKKTGNFL